MQPELPQLHFPGEGIRKGFVQGEQVHGGGSGGRDQPGNGGGPVGREGSSQAVEEDI